MAIMKVASRPFQNYENLSPIVSSEACDLKTFQQFLHFPCRYDNDALLEWLLKPLLNHASTELEGNVSILEGRDHAGYTPLLTAIFYGSIKCVKYLLQVSN